MPQPISTTWTPGRPNQQLVEQQRAAAERAPREQREHAELCALGQRLRAVFAGLPLPLIAVQTHFSLLEGTAAPRAWATVLGAWLGEAIAAPRDRRGGNHPAGAGAVARAAAALITAPLAGSLPRAEDPPALSSASSGTAGSDTAVAAGIWAALSDRDDLLALPAVIEAWGGRLAVGAVLRLDGGDSVLLASTAAAYRGLCRLLSARHAGIADELLAAGLGDDARGLVALVRQEATGRRFAQAGATVYWRAGLRPATGATPFPALAVPLLTHIDADRAAAGVLRAMRERGTIDPREAGGDALSDLLAMPAAYRGHEDQLARSAALRAGTWDVPDTSGRHLHHPPLPPRFSAGDADLQLRELAVAGIPARYPTGVPATFTGQLAHELQVIADKRFAPYLLTVWSIAQGRRTCGRGSAASSLVVYLLGITNVDPLASRLLFERFLSPERSDPPDIDIDFAWDERDAVFSEILARFGADRVGVVATHLHLKFDGALREAARAHGLGDDAISAMAGRRHDLARFGIDRDGARMEALPAPWPRIMEAALLLNGAPRHLGVHCGGVVITSGPLAEIVPVHPAAKRVPDPDEPAAMRAMPAIAWEKDGAELLGLVKIDVLGNRSLAVVRDALGDLAAFGMPLDEAAWKPQDDPPTKRLLATGATLGCFYIESPAMRQLQAKVGSGEFDRLVVHSSIIRPAGMEFIRTYIARYHVLHDPALSAEAKLAQSERERWYLHPAMRDLLSDSYGVLSYQEDVMVVAQRIAGFTSGEANTLRKALGRSDTAERLQKLVARFQQGCRANGVDDGTIALIWRMISSFAGYSFAKAHSASYAVVSFQCAWLKAHHPAVFLARVIANEGGFYHAAAYVEEARRLGLAILPPCVQHSHWGTRAEPPTAPGLASTALRIGFHRIAGLSRTSAEVIMRERERQPFTGVRNLLTRSGASTAEAQTLLEAGALDHLMPGRDPAQRAWIVAVACRTRGRTADAGAQQSLALGFGREDDPLPPRLPAVDAATLAWRRFRRLGLLPQAHPLSLWRIARRPATRARDLTPALAGRTVELVAIAITSKTVNAISGEGADERIDDMAFVTVEDDTGVLETTWFTEVYARHAVLLERHEPLRLSGVIEVECGVVSLVVRECCRCASALDTTTDV